MHASVQAEINAVSHRISRFINKELRKQAQKGPILTARIDMEDTVGPTIRGIDEQVEQVIERRLRRRGFVYVSVSEGTLPAHGSPYDTYQVGILLAHYDPAHSSKAQVVERIIDMLWSTNVRQFTLPFTLDRKKIRQINSLFRRSNRVGAKHFHLSISDYGRNRWGYIFPFRDGSDR